MGSKIAEVYGDEGLYNISDMAELYKIAKNNLAIIAPTEEMKRLLENHKIICIDPEEYRQRSVGEMKEMVGDSPLFAKSEGRRIKSGLVYVFTDGWFCSDESFVINENVTRARIYVPQKR